MKTFRKGTLTVFTLVSVLFLSFAVFANETTKNTEKDLVETAVDAGQFTILAKALEAAGLVDALKSGNKLTVFAPTDEAFNKLPEGTIENLLKPENKEKLKAILLYHVVDAKLSAKKVTKLNGRKLVTLQGGLLEINADNGVKINNTNVVKADVKAQNGVIHVIDTVLIQNE
jgi:uncharacterized surface protein with fasciclin (FAS1) repeats